MDHVYKFVGVTLLPLAYSLRERVRALFADPGFLLDLLILSALVSCAVWLWAWSVQRIKDIGLQMLIVVLAILAALLLSHGGLSAWENMQEKYPNWHTGAAAWFQAMFASSINLFSTSIKTLSDWRTGDNMTMPMQ